MRDCDRVVLFEDGNDETVFRRWWQPLHHVLLSEHCKRRLANSCK